jgi:cysteine-rich repeat protein
MALNLSQYSECSNGLLDAGEQCDDGNKLNYDGCSSSCTIEDGKNYIF